MNWIEKWNTVVMDVLKKKNESENVIQSLWESNFFDVDLFGYSRRRGEIDVWRKIRIGSSERTIPDIVIRNADRQTDLFVVEMKQYNRRFCEDYKKQLFSYMQLLDLNIGVLICDKIFLYYRKNNTTEYCMEIPFEEDNQYGAKFIELFSRNHFDNKQVEDFICTETTKLQRIQEIRHDFQQLNIKELIVEHYTGKYTAEEVREALFPYQIKVAQIVEVVEGRPAGGNGGNKNNGEKDKAEVYEEPEFEYILVKTSEKCIEERGNLYEASRYAWPLGFKRARSYEYVFSVIDGIVREVYLVSEWQKITQGEYSGRLEFRGEPADKSISKRFIGKEIPADYRKPGCASSALYKQNK